MTVEIRDYKFTPAHVTVPVGTTVRWVNAEKRTTHTVRLTVDGQLVESHPDGSHRVLKALPEPITVPAGSKRRARS